MAKKTKKGAGWIPPTEEAVLKASTDLIELVEASLPQRFYGASTRGSGWARRSS